MLRVLFTVPGTGISLHSFGFCLGLACLTAYGVACWRTRRMGLDPEIISGLSVWLFLGGILGARVLFVLQNPGVLESPAQILAIWQGGILFYGCILGGLAGSVLYWRRARFPFLAIADAVAPAVCVGIILGRIGCFLNGCCFGECTDRPWAVQFPAGTHAWERHVEAGWIGPEELFSLPVHPKQLYLAAAGLALLALLLAYAPRRRRDGELITLLMIAYPITRFATEFYRGDANGRYFGGLTISQDISLALIALGLILWTRLPRHLTTPAPAPAVTATPAPHRAARPARPVSSL